MLVLNDLIEYYTKHQGVNEKLLISKLNEHHEK
jgi:hypothetical protein